MTEYDVKRLAFILAIQAEIEGMKAQNICCSAERPKFYSEDEFKDKAEELRSMAYKHDFQL
jgi:hypothetical protein